MGMQRVSAGLLVAVGFVMGVAFIASCGGSAGTSTAAGPGVEVVRHVVPVAPQSASSASVLGRTLFSTTYTAPEADDLVLRISARGAYTTSDAGILLHLGVRNGSHTEVLASVGQTLVTGTDRAFKVSTAFDGFLYTVGPGAADGVYVIVVEVSNGNPAGSSIDFSALEIEVVTLHGVTRLDPSPAL